MFIAASRWGGRAASSGDELTAAWGRARLPLSGLSYPPRPAKTLAKLAHEIPGSGLADVTLDPEGNGTRSVRPAGVGGYSPAAGAAGWIPSGGPQLHPPAARAQRGGEMGHGGGAKRSFLRQLLSG